MGLASQILFPMPPNSIDIDQRPPHILFPTSASNPSIPFLALAKLIAQRHPALTSRSSTPRSTSKAYSPPTSPPKKRPPQVPPLPWHRLQPPARRREHRLAPPPLHHPHLRLLRVPPAPLRPLPLRAHPGKQRPTAPPNHSRRLPGMDGRRPQEPRHTARQLHHVRGLRDRGLHVPLAPPAACCSTSRLAGIQRPGLSRDFQAADEPDVQLHACCRRQRPLVEVLPAADHAVAAFGRDRVQHGRGGRDRGAEAAETERRRAQGLPRGPFASAGVELLARPKWTQVWSRGGCIVKWLDSHESGSVVYVSFGSQNTVLASQMMSLADGLESSGHPFVWVVRPPLGFDLSSEFRPEWLPQGFEERMRASGKGILIRRWAPQLEILSDDSTDAFLSHCRWNSVLESLSRGCA
ncbi:Uncharacterized protein M6B38_111850 [Iris pallida]|uniref:Uncharacterized protein n=1 Tax=Iris pallida TaxID=29817 RepID=A0AAX6DNB9_IRIPA|nr:Uncharacterized protein M6B38_111850 [Iris pallida]